MEEIEYLLLQKNECRAYEIPPAARSTGHLAEEWSNCIFQGKLKVMAKGKHCNIQLLTRQNELFVVCQIDPKNFDRCIERAKDSTRYFILTLVSPTGAKGYIGMGFEERNDAFDFWATLLDFVERNNNEEKTNVEVSGPDLSHLQLKAGQTFSLSGNASNPANTTKKLFKLQPPPK